MQGKLEKNVFSDKIVHCLIRRKKCTPKLSAKEDDGFIEKFTVESTGNEDDLPDESSTSGLNAEIKPVPNPEFSMKPQQEEQSGGSFSEEKDARNNPTGLVEESNFSYSTTPKKIEDSTIMLVGLKSF